VARIRTIKPQFFFNEDLARLPERTRLFYIGLWTQVDREGRGEDRPVRLRAEIFPYHPEIDAEEIMLELAGWGFLRRYSVNRDKYFVIDKFKEHQAPHHREPESKIPAPPPEEKRARKSPGKPGPSTALPGLGTASPGPGTVEPVRKGREGKGEEGKGLAAAPLEPAKDASTPSESKTPVQRIVLAYKIAKGNDPDDKAWDREKFPRSAAAAKSILECFGGDLDKAVVYLLGKGEEFDEKKLDWTLETVRKHAWDNRGKLTETNGNEHGKVDANRLLGQGRRFGAAPARELAGGALEAITSRVQEADRLGVPELHSRDEGEICSRPFLDDGDERGPEGQRDPEI
jgi:hypothetical protein